MAARRVLRNALVAALAVFALGSLVGVALLALERRGLVVLRRVPAPILMAWHDERGAAVAIVNTDTTPGSFLLEIEANTHFGREESGVQFHALRGAAPIGSATRVWVPARSIVLRARSFLGKRPFTAWLYDGAGSIGSLDASIAVSAVPRRSSFVLTWRRYSADVWSASLLPDAFYAWQWTAHEGCRVREGPAVHRSAGRIPYGSDCYDWDGTAPVVVTIDETTPPEIATFCAIAMRGAAAVGASEPVWAYPRDMTIIDERER